MVNMGSRRNGGINSTVTRTFVSCLTGLSISLISIICSNLFGFADTYSDACKSYASGDVAKAKEQFESAAKAYPKSWEVHYQLGNCYMHLKNRALAAQSYQKALDCNPPQSYTNHITKALAAVRSSGTGSQSGTGAPPGAPGGSGLEKSADLDKSLAFEDPIQQKLEARRKQILEDAKREASKIRADRMVQRKELEATGSQWYVTRDGGLKTSIARDVAREFDGETERMVTQVMSVAHQKAQAVNSP